MIPLENYLFLSLVLFCIGLFILVLKKNAIVSLMGIELMLNAANINFVAFSQHDSKLQGQIFSLFVIVVAAAETAVLLSILLKVYQHFRTIHLEDINQMKG